MGNLMSPAKHGHRSLTPIKRTSIDVSLQIGKLETTQFFSGWPELFRTAKIQGSKSRDRPQLLQRLNRFQSLHPYTVMTDIEG